MGTSGAIVPTPVVETLEAHASSHEAGGSDPITTLGAVTTGALECASLDIEGAFNPGAPVSGASPLIVLAKAFTAGAGGSADDVDYNPGLAFAYEIIDCFVIVTTTVALATVTARTATAGGGSAASSALLATTGILVRNAITTAPPAFAANGHVFLRRSDSGVAGTFYAFIRRTT